MFEAAWAMVGAVILWAFYTAIETKWPDTYVPVRDALEKWQRSGLLRLVVFRTLPVFVVSLFVAVTLQRHGSRPLLPLLAMLLVHLCSTSFRGFASASRDTGHSGRRAALFALHLASAIIVLTAGSLAWAARLRLDAFVPRLPEMTAAVWTAGFTAVVTVAAQRLTTTKSSDETSTENVIRDVGAKNWEYIARAARAENCDPPFLRAIVSAEVVQRPKWFRRLERIRGILPGDVTYGIAQERSNRPISDAESVDRLAATFHGYYPARTNSNGFLALRKEDLLRMFELHNPDKDFTWNALRFFEEFDGNSRAASSDVAPDYRPTVRVLDIARQSDVWIVSGDCWSSADPLSWTTSNDMGTCHWREKPSGPPARREWEARIPFEAEAADIGTHPDLTPNIEMSHGMPGQARFGLPH